MINSRQKGKRGELELAHFLRGHGFANAVRGQQFKGGGESPDVVGLEGWHIECKRVQAGNPYVWLDQAIEDSRETAKTPVVFHRRNGEGWIVILDADDFMAMLDRPAA